MKNCIYMLAPYNGTSGRQMMSFIITTDKEKVIVIDGGYRADAEPLLKKLREVTGREVPHVDGWILTHAHNDHIWAFCEIVENHRDEVTFDEVYYNFPSAQYCLRSDNDPAPLDFYHDLPLFADKVCIVSQGDRYRIGGIDFDILYTSDQSFYENSTNNSSTVFSFTFCGKKFIFLGDLGEEGGLKLLGEYGDALKSDYCQMAHHGQNGVTEEVYKAIDPRYCLYTAPLWLWNNDNGKGFDTHIWNTVKTRRWMDKLHVTESYNLCGGDVVIEL